MVRPKARRPSAHRLRPDGRRPLLVYMRPTIIKQLKKVALDEDRNAYEIAEEAVRQWLSTHKIGAHR